MNINIYPKIKVGWVLMSPAGNTCTVVSINNGRVCFDMESATGGYLGRDCRVERSLQSDVDRNYWKRIKQ